MLNNEMLPSLFLSKAPNKRGSLTSKYVAPQIKQVELHTWIPYSYIVTCLDCIFSSLKICCFTCSSDLLEVLHVAWIQKPHAKTLVKLS